MKKLLLLILVCISLSAFSQQQPQKKDTAQPKTYVLAGTEQSFTYLFKVLSQSKLQVEGEQLSFVQASELLKWIQSIKEISTEPPQKK